MKPRVLMMSQEVHPIPPLKGAAVEQWIDEVARRMKGVQPHVVSVSHPSRPDDEAEAGVIYHRIRIGRLYKRLFRKITRIDPFPYIRRVADYARQIDAQLLHIHNAPQFVAPMQKLLPSAKLVLHMHNEKAFGASGSVACLVGCSKYITDWFRRRDFAADRFSVLPNGVDVERFRPGPVDLELRRSFGIPDDAFVVQYVGRISPEKGVDRLVSAFREIRRPGVHLLLVGEWPQGDARASERVRFAAELRRALDGLPHTIIDVISPSEVHRYFHLGDVIVVPSRFEEPFSMVAIEAMASGIPVVAARKGGMVEYLRHGANSLLFDAEAGPEAIAEVIQVVHDDSRMRHDLTAAGRKLVCDQFDWNIVADRTAAFYHEILSGRHA